MSCESLKCTSYCNCPCNSFRPMFFCSFQHHRRVSKLRPERGRPASDRGRQRPSLRAPHGERPWLRLCANSRLRLQHAVHHFSCWLAGGSCLRRSQSPGNHRSYAAICCQVNIFDKLNCLTSLQMFQQPRLQSLSNLGIRSSETQRFSSRGRCVLFQNEEWASAMSW